MFDGCSIADRLTVSKNEFGNTGKVHGNGTKEIVIAVQANQTGRCHSTSQTAKGEDGGCVWDQEAKKTE